MYNPYASTIYGLPGSCAADPCLPVNRTDLCNPNPCLPVSNPFQLDASAIFYHKDGCTSSRLTCLKTDNGVPVDLILEAIDAKLCRVVNCCDYTDFPMPCLRNRYVITDVQSYLLATDTELCRLETVIANNYMALDTKITYQGNIIESILYPNITDSCNLGGGTVIDQNTTIMEVLQILTNTICGLNGVVGADISPSIGTFETSTALIRTSGPKLHDLQPEVKVHNVQYNAKTTVDTTLPNAIQILSTGLYVPLSKETNQTQSLSWDGITRVLGLSNSNSVIIGQDAPPNLSFDCTTKTLSLGKSGTPSVNLSCLMQNTSTETTITAIDNNTIVWTLSGTTHHTIGAEVRIDTVKPGNAIVANGHNGIYAPVALDTVITTKSSNSAIVTAALISKNSYEISSNVKVAPNQGDLGANSLIIVPDTPASGSTPAIAGGLFAPFSAETPNTKTDSASTTVTLTSPNSRNICVNVRVQEVAGNMLTIGSDSADPTNPAKNGLVVLPQTQLNASWLSLSGISQVLNKPSTLYGNTATNVNLKPASDPSKSYNIRDAVDNYTDETIGGNKTFRGYKTTFTTAIGGYHILTINNSNDYNTGSSIFFDSNTQNAQFTGAGEKVLNRFLAYCNGGETSDYVVLNITGKQSQTSTAYKLRTLTSLQVKTTAQSDVITTTYGIYNEFNLHQQSITPGSVLPTVYANYTCCTQTPLGQIPNAGGGTPNNHLTVTNYYGNYIENPTQGGTGSAQLISNIYGYYQHGTNGSNVFEAPVKMTTGFMFIDYSGVDPTTATLPAGMCQVIKGATGKVQLWANDGGVLKSALLN